MEAYQKIESEINLIKEINQEAGNQLHNQMHHAQNTFWSISDLSEYIKSENDVAESFDENSEIYSDIRNAQDLIIGFYGK